MDHYPRTYIEGTGVSRAQFSSETIKEIPIGSLQLETHASNVGNDGNERSPLNLGTVAMPQTRKHRDLIIWKIRTLFFRSAGVDKKLDRLKRKLGLNEQMVKTQKRGLGREHPPVLSHEIRLVSR